MLVVEKKGASMNITYPRDRSGQEPVQRGERRRDRRYRAAPTHAPSDDRSAPLRDGDGGVLRRAPSRTHSPGAGPRDPADVAIVCAAVW
jgi:hypothetical protein